MWANIAKAFVYVVKELGFPVVVCTALWFDLRPQLNELVTTQRKILEVQSALAVRKCIPTGQEWIPSPQSFLGGKNPPRCYGLGAEVGGDRGELGHLELADVGG